MLLWFSLKGVFEIIKFSCLFIQEAKLVWTNGGDYESWKRKLLRFETKFRFQESLLGLPLKLIWKGSLKLSHARKIKEMAKG